MASSGHRLSQTVKVTARSDGHNTKVLDRGHTAGIPRGRATGPSTRSFNGERVGITVGACGRARAAGTITGREFGADTMTLSRHADTGASGNFCQYGIRSIRGVWEFRFIYTHVTCRLTAKNRDQLRNPTLGTRVWATFYMFLFLSRPRSEGWPHHGRTFSIYPCPLSF